MKEMVLRLSTLLLALIMVLTLICGCSKTDNTVDDGGNTDDSADTEAIQITTTVYEIAKHGNLVLDIVGSDLFEKGYEYGEHEGLGLIKGDIVPIKDSIDEGLKIPHIGWNALHFKGEKSPIFKYINDGDFVYFVHSYHGQRCEESTIAVTEYGGTLTAAVAKDNVFGCQFHPEKSGEVGLKILRAFCEIEV